MAHVQVHRFHDKVAVYLGGGETAYLAPEVADAIADAMKACANDVLTRRFSGSSLGTFQLDCNTSRYEE